MNTECLMTINPNVYQNVSKQTAQLLIQKDFATTVIEPPETTIKQILLSAAYPFKYRVTNFRIGQSYFSFLKDFITLDLSASF